ncbi:MAG: CBS domain-containing protein [Actinomycetota bacterium]|nr:CBS domain-containing protein [Actinomycetota bacterium]
MRIGDVMSVRAVTVGPDETVQVAIGRMMEENIGAVAVCEGPRLVGIFTERDVLRLASEGSGFQDLRMGDVMTRKVVTAAPDVHILDAAQLMGERRIRHLPVVEGENLLGMAGIRDVLRTLVERLWREHDVDARETVHDLLRRAR